MGIRRTDRLWMLGGLVAIILIVVAAYLLAIKPIYTDRADKQSQVDDQEMMLVTLRRQLADLKTMQIMKLHFREPADPTGLVGDEVLTVARAHSDAMVAMLCRELGVGEPDDDLRRLATSLIALAADFLTSAEWIRQIAPRLYADAGAIDRMTDRLTGYAVAMLAYEGSRRRAVSGSPV